MKKNENKSPCRWHEYRSVSQSIKVVKQIAWKCSKLGGPITQQLYCYVKDNNWLDLIDYKFNYHPEMDQNDLFYARQIHALVSKQSFIDLGIDREKVAYDKFIANEKKCKETNERFRSGVQGNPDVEAVLFIAQRKIAQILGPVPSYDKLNFSFGPGVNTSTASDRCSHRAKLSSVMACGPNLLPYLPALLEECALWSIASSPKVIGENPPVSLECGTPILSHEHDVWTDEIPDVFRVSVEVHNGRLAFVPKTCREDRSIVVEPILNGFAQKGIGTYIRNRLIHFGMDINNQGGNQEAARKGSIRDDLATLDLSAASDTVAFGFLLNILPLEWFELLDATRSSVVEYKGERIRLEKFSSMGNAYTFELESLIFFSLAKSVCDYLSCDSQEVLAYGDDIIVPSICFPLLSSVLEHCGFVVNHGKTYASGPFRESCGADFFLGMNIRPYYLKDKISDRCLYTMHNWFLRAGEYQLAEEVIKYIKHPRLYGPDGFGDGHLIGSYHLNQSRAQKRKGWCGGSFQSYRLKPARYSKREINDWVWPYYFVHTRQDPEVVPDPNVVRGSRGSEVISIYTHREGIFLP